MTIDQITCSWSADLWIIKRHLTKHYYVFWKNVLFRNLPQPSCRVSSVEGMYHGTASVYVASLLLLIMYSLQYTRVTCLQEVTTSCYHTDNPKSTLDMVIKYYVMFLLYDLLVFFCYIINYLSVIVLYSNVFKINKCTFDTIIVLFYF